MTEQEFFEWLQTCPTSDWIIVHKEGGLRTVNFIVEKPSKRNVGPYVLAQEPS